MRRVCSALGTWQLVMLSAALRQDSRDRGEAAGGGVEDVLLIYGRSFMPEHLQELMPRIASAVWPWDRVVWADELIDDPIPGKGAAELREMIRKLRDRVGIDRVDQLWMSKLWARPEKRICETFPEAAVSCYEEGLHDYLPHPVERWYEPYRGKGMTNLARAVLHRLDGRYRRSALSRVGVLDRSHAGRVSRAYLSIAEQVPPPQFLAGLPRTIIAHESLREAVSAASAALVPDREWKAPDRPTIVVLGQCFWRWGGADRGDEIRACRGAVRSLVDRGYRVLWKDHPRAEPPLADEVGEGLGKDRFEVLDLPQACPVELVLGRLGAAAIASASSSALFYAPKVSGVRAYQIREAFDGLDRDFGEMFRMTSQYIDPIEDLPEAGKLATASSSSSSTPVVRPMGARQ